MDESPSFVSNRRMDGEESPSFSSVDKLYMGDIGMGRSRDQGGGGLRVRDDDISCSASEGDEGVSKVRTESTLTENTCVYMSASCCGGTDDGGGIVSEQTQL